MAYLEPGDLDGFTVESADQLADRESALLRRSQAFDPRALSSTAGLRAVWILVRRERWAELYELGIDRCSLEPKLGRVANYEESIDDRQVKRLLRLYPELGRASGRLRELYVLQSYLKGGLR